MINLNEFLHKGEGITVEFKECKTDLPKNLFDTVCAFLNRCGGDIFLGVNDDATIIGVDEAAIKTLKSNFASLCNNSNKIFPTVYLGVDDIIVADKHVLHIHVPESSQVHNINGKVFDRNEDGDFEITGNTNSIAQMYIRKQREFTENTVFPYATMNDLQSETIDRVRRMAVNRQAHHPWESLNNEDLLRSAGLYRQDMQTGESGYTLACLLLFGKRETILSAIPYYKTDAILRRENLDRYDDRDDIRCNLIESYDRLMNFIEKHLDDKFYMQGDVRVDVRSKLFREIVVNLLIHREFSNPYPAKLVIEKDRVTTENGNKAHGFGEINIDDFMPFPKNPVIAFVFKEIGWAEELGSGVRNIKKYAKIYSDATPIFIEGDTFKTVIPIKEVAVGDKKPPIKTADKKPPIKTADNQKRILEFLAERITVSSKEIEVLLGLKDARVKEILREMAKAGLIVAEGSNRNRRYKLKDE